MPKNIFIAATFSLSFFFCFAQSPASKNATEQNELWNIYHQWKNVSDGKNKFVDASGARMATTLFYPAKATNYNWSTLSSSWNFNDTTLYTYAGVGLVSSATRKDNSNNFISRTLTAYDTSSNVIEMIFQTWSAGWLNIYRDTFVFDNYNQLIRHEYQTWGGSQWNVISGDLIQNTYSGSGKITLQIVQTWSDTDAVWVNSSQKTNTYSASDKITQTLAESWSTTTSNWQSTSLIDYTYDVSDINIQSVFKFWNGSAWQNFTQTISIIWSVWTGEIATSKPQSYVIQTWNGSAWVNSQQLQNATYDSFGGSIETFRQYISGNWVNDVRNSEFFDIQLNKTGAREETWNIPVGVWDTTYEYRYLFTYDANFSITESIYQLYNNGLHNYVNSTKAVYTDFLFLNVSEINADENISVAIYPNPVNDFSEVIVSSDDFILVAYKIYDLHGRMIRSEAIRAKKFRLDKNNFSSGIYLLYVFDASGETTSLKFVVQ